MSRTPSLNDRIVIVGAGAFGLATAYTLALEGYTNVTVLEKSDQVPSPASAGFDLNKIIRAEYIDPFYTGLALDAIRKWQTDPLYTPYYREVGFLNVISGSAPPAIRSALRKYEDSIAKIPDFQGKIHPLKDAASVRAVVPEFSGPLNGWEGYLNRLAGYVHSANAMEAVYNAALAKGVRFHLGPLKGDVRELVYAGGSQQKQVIGAKSHGGDFYAADLVILALGANVARLLPSIAPQAKGTCWGVAHIQLTAEEAARLRGIPVTNVRDLGFFFEPDKATNKLKFCHMGGGYSNYGSSPSSSSSPQANGQSQALALSLPYSSLEQSKFLPSEDEKQIRRLLRQVLPEFADRPLIDAHLCWFADSPDSDYIIDFVPDTAKSLIVLSGDSGHGFKMIPIFGDFVSRLLHDGEQTIRKWRWKVQAAQAAQRNDTAEQVAWRASKIVDLSQIRAKL